jgi:hypothetical protein
MRETIRNKQGYTIRLVAGEWALHEPGPQMGGGALIDYVRSVADADARIALHDRPTIREVVRELGLLECSTGGSSTALHMQLPGGQALITTRDDVAPTDLNTDPQDELAIGVYADGQGSAVVEVVCVPARCLRDVLRLMRGVVEVSA